MFLITATYLLHDFQIKLNVRYQDRKLFLLPFSYSSYSMMLQVTNKWRIFTTPRSIAPLRQATDFNPLMHRPQINAKYYSP
jgi:hypothetical protein